MATKKNSRIPLIIGNISISNSWLDEDWRSYRAELSNSSRWARFNFCWKKSCLFNLTTFEGYYWPGKSKRHQKNSQWNSLSGFFCIFSISIGNEYKVSVLPKICYINFMHLNTTMIVLSAFQLMIYFFWRTYHLKSIAVMSKSARSSHVIEITILHVCSMYIYCEVVDIWNADSEQFLSSSAKYEDNNYHELFTGASTLVVEDKNHQDDSQINSFVFRNHLDFLLQWWPRLCSLLMTYLASVSWLVVLKEETELRAHTHRLIL